jgi:hypothetical protein
MKGAYGVIFAVFLGVLGGVLNWLYLENKTRDVASISFLGISEGVIIAPGQPLSGRHFVEVRIPERHAKNLQDFVYLYEDHATLEGSPATRNYEGGELVFRADHRTPPAELKLDDNEEMFWVPVDSRSFVPSIQVIASPSSCRFTPVGHRGRPPARTRLPPRLLMPSPARPRKLARSA